MANRYPDLPMSDKDRYALSLAVKHRSWEEYQQHAEQVDARNLQNFAEQRPLAVAPKTLDDSQATTAQLELFNLVGQSTYDYVESLIRKLPHKRQQEYFRTLYLREYRSVRNDGSIAYLAGNKQRLHANVFLREVLEQRLNLVLKQYQFDFAWLQLDISEKQQWALKEIASLPPQPSLAPTQASGAKNKIPSPACGGGLGWGQGAKRKRTALEKKAHRPFFLLTEKQIEQLAKSLADCFLTVQTDHFTKLAEARQDYSAQELDGVVLDLFRKCGAFCQGIGFVMPYWETFQRSKKPRLLSVEIALNRVVCEKYWFSLLRKIQRQMVEHLAIACGDVRKNVSAYISAHGFNEHKMQVKKNYDFLKAMIVENVENPEEQVELLDMYLRSNANPTLRRLEMMTRLRGVEEWAEETGHIALFLTLTAPSAFHAQLSRGGQNRKWNGSSPKATQAYLNKVWQQMRALFKKHGIPFYGMRVAEPHHDATPHWHLLTFVRPEHRDKFVEIFRKKALELDGNERGAKKHRCKVEDCDKEKGTVTGYIAKYIAKNIDGFAEEGEMSDEVKDLSLKDNAKRARAWACMWGIRQFQFYGAGSIGVWRELRRLVEGQCDDERLEELRICADLGDYAAFVDRLGGCGAPRKEQVATLHYEETGTNAYGEPTKRINGIANRFRAELAKAMGHAVAFVCTRLKKWAIKRRPQDFAVAEASQGEAEKSEHRSPWTCVSNCNPLNINEKPDHTPKFGKLSVKDFIQYRSHAYERLKNVLNARQLPQSWLNDNHIYTLLNGGAVKISAEEAIIFNGYEIEYRVAR